MRRLLITAITTSFALSLALAASTSAAPRLYVPQYASGPPNVMAAFDRAPDGSLSPTPGSPYPIGGIPPAGPGGLYAAGFAPDGDRAAASFLFTGGLQGITVAPDGTMARAGGPTSTSSATGIAVSPDGRFVYVPTRNFNATMAVGIQGFALAADGSVTPLPSSPYSSGEIGDIAMTPDGRFLFAQTADGIRRFAVGDDGALTPLGDLTLSEGVITLDVSPNGRFLFAILEDASSNFLVSYSIDAAGGLTQNGEQLDVGESSVEFLSVAADGRHVYVPEANNDVVVTAAVADDGTLAAAGSTPVTDIASAAASPDGRFLYVWDRLTVRTMPIAADGVPAEPLPGSVPLGTSTPSRMLFQPQPAPQAKFVVKKRAAPGKAMRFDAGKSKGAVRYEWDFGDGTVAEDAGPTPSHKYKKAGKYDVTLSVYDESGCGPQQVYTGHSTSCPGGAEATFTRKADTLPILKKLKVKPRTFAKGVKPKIVYKLSEKATVTMTLERKPKSRFAGFAKAVDKGKKGKNSLTFNSGVFAKGRYTITARAKDKTGGKSKRLKTGFVIR